MNIKSVERLAREYLSGKRKKATTDLQKEARKYANRLKKYAEISKKKSIPSEAREALHYVTASEYANRKRKRDYAQNVRNFINEFGKPDEMELIMLQFRSFGRVARESGKSFVKANVWKKGEGVTGEREEKKGEVVIENFYDKKFSTPKLGTVRWNQLPVDFRMRQRQWPHGSGSYMYNNSDQFWDGSQVIDLDVLAAIGTDGFDHSNSDFFVSVVARIRPDIFFQVGTGGEVWYTTKAEWNSKKELSPDYLDSRKYR